MTAGLPARLFLLLAAACLLIFGRPAVAGLCLAPICLTYWAVGERPMLLGYVRPILVLVAVSAFLWTLVYLDFSRPDFLQATAHLLVPSAPFALLIRMVVATTLIILAIGSAPDGADLALARSLGLGLNGAIVYAGAKSSISLIRDSFARSLGALRAHGVVGTTRFSWLVRLPSLLRLTWTSCLHMMVTRSEVKWERNGFLAEGAAALARKPHESRSHNAYCFFCSIIVMLLVLWGAAWR